MSFQLVQQGITVSQLNEEIQQRLAANRFEHLQNEPTTYVVITHSLPDLPTAIHFFEIDDAENLRPIYFVNFKFLKEFDFKKIEICFVEPTRFLLILGAN